MSPLCVGCKGLRMHCTPWVVDVTVCVVVGAQEVLLIHEIEQLIEAGPPSQFATVLPSVLPVLMRCISSDNCRVAQRALQMFSSDKCVSMRSCHPCAGQ